MADNKLTLATKSAGIEHETPEVKTLARPVAAPLLAARHETQRNPKIQAAFRQARTEQWDAARLAAAIEPELRERLEGSDEQIHEVAVFLADEYTQIGDATLIVSRTTGRAIARITDKDIWQPPDVPRESGGLAKPLPRLRPDLEGFLVQWVFDEDREHRIVSTLTERTPQTELLRVEGDRRLLAATKAGRSTLTQNLQDKLSTLLGAVQGDARTFLDCFEQGTEPPSRDGLTPLLTCTAVSRIVSPIADSLAMNPRYDQLSALGAQTATGWVRDIARTLALAAKDKADARGKVECSRLTAAVTLGANLWLGEPSELAFVRPLAPVCLPVDGAPLTGLLRVEQGDPVGAIVLKPESYECRSRELFDRWEVVSVVEYTLYVDWTRVVSLELLGVPQEAEAELVR